MLLQPYQIPPLFIITVYTVKFSFTRKINEKIENKACVVSSELTFGLQCGSELKLMTTTLGGVTLVALEDHAVLLKISLTFLFPDVKVNTSNR